MHGQRLEPDSRKGVRAVRGLRREQLSDEVAGHLRAAIQTGVLSR
jgi:hypothetical protein